MGPTRRRGWRGLAFEDGKAIEARRRPLGLRRSMRAMSAMLRRANTSRNRESTVNVIAATRRQQQIHGAKEHDNAIEATASTVRVVQSRCAEARGCAERRDRVIAWTITTGTLCGPDDGSGRGDRCVQRRVLQRSMSSKAVEPSVPWRPRHLHSVRCNRGMRRARGGAERCDRLTAWAVITVTTLARPDDDSGRRR